MKKIIWEKGLRQAMYATVKGIKSQVSKTGKKQVIVTLEDDTPVFFTDREEGRGIATRVEKMKVREGSNILLDVTKSSNSNALFGNNVAYSGNVIKMKDGDNDIFIIVSKVFNKATFDYNDKNGKPVKDNIRFRVLLYNRELEGDNKNEFVDVVMFTRNGEPAASRFPESAEVVGILATGYREEERTGNDGKKYKNKSYTAESVYSLD